MENSGTLKKLSNFIIAILSIFIIIMIFFMVRNINSIATDEEPENNSEPVAETTSSDIKNLPDVNSEPPLGNVPINDNEPITIEILNGVGTKGLAYKIRNHLQRNFVGKIDIYRYENAISFNYNNTLIIDRRLPFDRDDKIEKLKRMTGISRVVNQRYECGVDASIVIGADWELYFPQIAEESK